MAEDPSPHPSPTGPETDAGGGRHGIGVRGRLMLTFAGIALVTLASAGIGWWAFQNVRETVTTVADTHVPEMMAIQTIARDSWRLSVQANDLANAEDSVRRRSIFNGLKFRLDTIRGALGDWNGAQQDAIARDLGQTEEAFLSLNEAVASRLATESRLNKTVQGVRAQHKAILDKLNPRLRTKREALGQSSAGVTATAVQSLNALVNTEVARVEALLALRSAVRRFQANLARLRASSDEKSLAAARSGLVAAREALDGAVASLPTADDGETAEVAAAGRALAQSVTDGRDLAALRAATLAEGNGASQKRFDAALEKIAARRRQLLDRISAALSRARTTVRLKKGETARQVAQGISALVNQEVKDVLTHLRLQSAVNRVAGVLTAAVTAQSREALKRLTAEFTAAKDRTTAQLNNLQSPGPLSQTVPKLLAYGEGEEQVFALRRKALATRTDMETALNAAQNAASQLNRHVDAAIKARREAVKAGAQASRTAIRVGQTALVVAALVLMAIVLLAWVYIYFNIGRRLGRLTQQTKRIAAGELDTPIDR